MRFLLPLLLLTVNVFGQVWNVRSTGQSNQINAVDFVDANVGYMVGDAGTVLKTTNAGSSWTNVGSGLFDNLTGVHAINSTTVVVIGGSNVYRTTNSGTAWSTDNSIGYALEGVDFPNSTTGYVTGYNGLISNSTDGGSSWSQQTSGSINIVRAVASFDANAAVVVTDIGEIIRTTNAGALWVQIYSPDNPVDLSNTPLNDIAVLDGNTALAGGNSGTLIKTTNKGATWSLVTFSPGGAINRLHFSSSTNGFAIVDHQKVYKTTNGGTSWTLSYSYSGSAIDDIHTFSSSSAYANRGAQFFVLGTNTPVATAGSEMNTHTFLASWEGNDAAVHYYLDVATSSDYSSMVSGYNNKDIGTGASQWVTGLDPGVTYYYRVRMMDGVNTSANSNTISVTTLDGVPTASAATGIGITYFTANWGNFPGAVKYYFDVARDAAFTDFVSGYNNKDVGDQLTYTVTGLSPLTTYYYRVRMWDGAITSASSATISLTTVIGTPDATDATGVTASAFTANWGSVTGAIKYRLDVARNESITDTVTGFYNKDVGTATSYLVDGLSGGTFYYYRVKAVSSVNSGNHSNTITVATAPGPPTATAATKVFGKYFTANWNAVSGADRYYLDVATDIDFTSFVSGFQDLNVGNVLNQKVVGLSENTTYYYRIRSYKNSALSVNSNVITATTNNFGWSAIADVTTEHLMAIRFSDLDHGVIAGNNGTILRTTDGGTSWSEVLTSTTNTLNGISFIDANIGYISGQSGTIMKTTDAGENWTEIDGLTGNFFNVKFQDENTGYALRGLSSDFVSTTDGGNTWQTTDMSLSSSNIWLDFHISGTKRIFVGINTASTLFGAIIRSTDNGSNWSIQNASVGSLFYNLEYVDTNLAYVAGSPGVIMKSTNGGTTWSTQTSGTTNELFSIKFVDAANGVAVGQNGTILMTADGGATWEEHYSGTSSTFNSVAYLQSGAIFAVGNDGVIFQFLTLLAPVSASATNLLATGFTANWNAVSSATKYYLDVATDAQFTSFVPGYSNVDVGTVTNYDVTGLSSGTTYYYRVRAYDGSQTSRSSQSRSATLQLTSEILFGAAPLDAAHWLVVGSTGTILRTTDGGTNWSMPSSGVTGTLMGVSYPSAASAIAVGDEGVILRSTDGGATWAAQTSNTINHLTCVDFVDANVGYAGGMWGTLLKTTDGGATWAVLTTPSGLDMYTSLSFLDADHGVVVGSNGFYMKTTDGGANWNVPYPVTLALLYGIEYIDANNSIIVGEMGNIIASNDAGANFYGIDPGITNNLRSVVFINSNNGFIVGSNGVILRTTNGGSNWSSVASGTTSELNAVEFSASGIGLAVGENGTIIKLSSTVILPVELTLFTANVTKGAVELLWKTATELNNAGFEIERSAVSSLDENSDTWTKIGALDGQGTSNNSHEYLFIDASAKGNVRYRLKQIDHDGNFKYTQMVEAHVGAPMVFALSQNYPNPFNPSTTIEFTLQNSGLTSLKVYDAIGREVATLVNEVLEAGVYHQRTFDASRLSSGVYFARLTSAGKVQIKKMLLMK